MKQQDKTNVMRILDQKGIDYESYSYEPDPTRTGEQIARLLGQDPEAVFKTLVTVARSGEHYVFVIPVAESLNLKEAARACREKSVEMIPQRALLPNTGYVHGGCSPIGMKKLYPTFIDETAQLFDSVCVSAGRIGAQIELAPDDLCRLTQAQYAPLTEP